MRRSVGADKTLRCHQVSNISLSFQDWFLEPLITGTGHFQMRLKSGSIVASGLKVLFASKVTKKVAMEIYGCQGKLNINEIWKHSFVIARYITCLCRLWTLIYLNAVCVNWDCNLPFLSNFCDTMLRILLFSDYQSINIYIYIV